MSQLLGSKLKKAIPRYVDYRKTVSKTPVRTEVFDWVSENGVMTSKRYPYKENDSVSCPSEERRQKL
ncbi:unnamed protein product [Cercopithifilaria johnstoni]|uniref:Uncharacterized protein n=1 Tax=Cercopithifilaria johnstoni TaxID=2874296 RepID=A0A8J2PWQ9_9BILA|nr:unnamed protein product [Cercopithifilaria johnstoni]